MKASATAFAFVFAASLALAADAPPAPPLTDEAVQALTAPLSPDEERELAALAVPPSSPKLPDDRNAAVIYRKVFEMLEADKPVYRSDGGVLREQVSSGRAKALESGLPEPLPLGADGTPAPGGYSILYTVRGMECIFVDDWSGGAETMLPHLSQMRELARLLAFQMRSDMEQDRPERALEHARLIFTMSDHLKPEPTLISNLVALALESIARNTLTIIALEPGRSPEFLRSSSALVRERSTSGETAGRAIRGDAHVFASSLARSISSPGADVDRFLTAVAAMVPSSDGNDGDAAGQASPSDVQQGMREFAGVPEAALTGEPGRRVAARMTLFYWRQAARLADAADSDFAAVAAVDRDVQSWKAGGRLSPPEALLGAMLIPALTACPASYFKNKQSLAAGAAVLEAVARGDRRIGQWLDPYGKPYTVTWLDDCVYFETASTRIGRHDLDFCVGRWLTYDEFQKRTADK